MGTGEKLVEKIINTDGLHSFQLMYIKTIWDTGEQNVQTNDNI